MASSTDAFNLLKIKWKKFQIRLAVLISLNNLKSLIISLFDFTLIVLRILLIKPKLIFIGDSHAHFFFENKKIKRFSLKNRNKLIIWLGPKLLYSVSRNGFELKKRVRIILRIASNNQPVVILLGEIDCRVHFVEKTLVLGIQEFDNIAYNYKNFVISLIDTYGFAKAIIIAPFPPSNLGLDNLKFPRNGSISDRVLVTKLITESLLRISSTQFNVINCSPLISIKDGSLDEKYTDDGVHLNFLGSKKIIDKIDFKNI